MSSFSFFLFFHMIIRNDYIADFLLNNIITKQNQVFLIKIHNELFNSIRRKKNRMATYWSKSKTFLVHCPKLPFLKSTPWFSSFMYTCHEFPTPFNPGSHPPSQVFTKKFELGVFHMHSITSSQQLGHVGWSRLVLINDIYGQQCILMYSAYN